MEWRGVIRVRDLAPGLRDGSRRGLALGLEHILGEAMRLVPNEEGTLERSGRVSVDDGALTGAVSFDTIYAVRQHEELGWRHSDGRQAKYLEQPLTSEASVVADLVAAEVRRALR
mgnify:CR=1 FL=1